MRTTKLFGGLVNTVVLSLVLITILLVGYYFFSRSQKEGQTIFQNPPTQDEVPVVNLQAERQALKAIEDKVKEPISERNGWKHEDYTLNIYHIDAKFVAGKIVPNNSDIPEGVFLVKNAAYYPVVFDSTNKNPCNLLEANTIYPQVVTDLCDK